MRLGGAHLSSSKPSKVERVGRGGEGWKGLERGCRVGSAVPLTKRLIPEPKGAHRGVPRANRLGGRMHSSPRNPCHRSREQARGLSHSTARDLSRGMLQAAEEALRARGLAWRQLDEAVELHEVLE